MMCQKNCGSTVQKALLQLDLTSVARYLRDHYRSSNSNTNSNSSSHSNNNGENTDIVVGVQEAMADYPTSYASLVIQCQEGGSDYITDQHDGGDDDDELTPTKISDFSIDDDDEEEEVEGGEDNGNPNNHDNEIRNTIIKLVADLAISELEDIGFDAQFLSTERDVIAHRECSARDKLQKDNTNKENDDSSFMIEQEEKMNNGILGGGNGVGGIATFHVGGMSCAVCAGSVERHFLSVGAAPAAARSATAGGDNGENDNGENFRPRVLRAAVSLPTNTARVTFSDISSSASTYDDELVLMKVYRSLAEECAATLTKGGYTCEILNIQVSPSSINPTASSSAGGAAEEWGGTSSSLLDGAARMERTRREELHQWKFALLTSLTFTVPLAVIHFASMSMTDNMNIPTDDDSWMSPAIKDFMMFLLATPVQFGVGRRYYMSAYRGLIHGCTLGMDFLVALGTSAAYLYSTFVFVYQRIAEMNHNNDNDVDPVMKLTPTFETGAWLITFVTLGKYLEAYARGKTAGALQTLMELQPVSATRAILSQEVMDELNCKLDAVLKLKEGGEIRHNLPVVLSKIDLNSIPTEESDISEIRVGDYLLVLPGGRIPTDCLLVAREGCGKIMSGRGDDNISISNESKGGGYAYIDESAFSGEPFPIAKRPGDLVYGASVNQLSVILVRVTATGEATALSRIVRLVDEAQGNRAPIQAQAGECPCAKLHSDHCSWLANNLFLTLLACRSHCVNLCTMRDYACHGYLCLLDLAVERVFGNSRRKICGSAQIGNQRDCGCMSVRIGSRNSNCSNGE